MRLLIIGSGPYRIGSSVEFDCCCVSAARAARKLGHEVVMLNCNPETVSTDWDESDFLFFEEPTPEKVIGIYERAKCDAVVVSFGGQVANNLVVKLHSAGLNILGTSFESIDQCESRDKFSMLCDSLRIPQPEWSAFAYLHDAWQWASERLPVIVRPSYVLSGSAMKVCYDLDQLKAALERAERLDADHPVVVSKFYEDANELDVDGIAIAGRIPRIAISEHVEKAGTHSGDATLLFPAGMYATQWQRYMAMKYAEKLVAKLNITGPFNVQFLAKGDDVRCIEMNLRASRSLPFVSKVSGFDLPYEAMQLMLGDEDGIAEAPNHGVLGNERKGPYGCKMAQFSFSRLRGADPVSGVEMASTGEVGCVASTRHAAIYLALESVGFEPIEEGDAILVSSGMTSDKMDLQPALELASENEVEIYGTEGTADFARKCSGYPIMTEVGLDGPEDVLEIIRKTGVKLVINVKKHDDSDVMWDDRVIRRAAVDAGIPLITNARLAALALTSWVDDVFDEPKSLEELVG
jgi:carbamoyl-phosphate synthase large subunit